MEHTDSMKLITEETLAKYLQVSLACLRRWRVERRGPAFIHVGRLVRYEWHSVESWLARQPRGGELIGARRNAR
jgi:predicted DNA-binding transcriptional regulator AlpA